MSPLATPLLMMSALRSGRYRLPIAWTSSRTRTTTSWPRVRPEVGPEQADHGSASAVGCGRRRARAADVARRQLATRRAAHRPQPDEAGLRARRRSVAPAARASVLAAVRASRSRKTASPGVGRVDEDDPPVRRVVAALDEAALLHPVDDAGRAGDRDVERLGEPAHRQRALGLEDRQDVEVDEAERAAQPAPEQPMRSRGFQAVSSSTTASSIASRPPIIQCHIDNLARPVRIGVKRPRPASAPAAAERLAGRRDERPEPAAAGASSPGRSARAGPAAARRSSRPRAAPGAAAARPG